MLNEKIKKTKIASGKDDIAKYYEKYAQSWDHRFGKNKSAIHFLNKRLDILKDLAQFSPKDKVLEIGCGTAFHLVALSPNFNNGTGVDISPQMLSVAKKHALLIDNNKLKFILDDAETLKKIPSNSFDVVFFIGLIEHLVNPKACLKNCRRILKQDGVLIGFTPNRYSPWYGIIGPLFRASTTHLTSDKHYSAKEIRNMLSHVGYKKQLIKYWGFIPGGDIPDFLFKILKPIEIIAEISPLRFLAGGIAFRAKKGK